MTARDNMNPIETTLTQYIDRTARNRKRSWPSW
jgi:hypothetical protein